MNIKEKILSIFKKIPLRKIGEVGSVKDETVITGKSSVYNYILLSLASVLAIILIIAVIPSSKNGPKIANTNKNQTEAKIKLSKETINITSASIDKMHEDGVIVTVLEGKLKIDSVKLDPNTPSVMLKENCIEKGELVSGISDCSINIYWKPIEQEEESPKIIIKWTDLSSKNPIYNTSIISMYLETEKAEVKKEVFIEPEPAEKIELKKVEPVKEKATVKPISDLTPVKNRLDCKRRATTAFGLNGNPIGWVSPDGTVYSQRCASILGHLNSKGEIIDNSGKLIGYNTSALKDKKLKEMITMSIPDDWFDYDNKKARDNEKWKQKLEKRSAQRKAGGGEGEKKRSISSLKLSDPKNVYADYINSKIPFTIKNGAQISSLPKDETYVIRRFKPIPAVIAYPIFTSKGYGQMPAIGIIERNVYGEDGRVVLIPAGSKILGQATGTWPNTYVEYSKVQIQWFRIIRPDGAEFTFEEGEAISGDAQGRLGVPGKGATDYLKQFVQPMITALVPAAINMLNPVASAYTSKIILNNDGSTTNQMQGEERSQEKAKQELIKTWNTVAEKFVKDSMENNVPPFEVPAGTRITIYPTKDIMLRFDNFTQTNKNGEKNYDLQNVDAGAGADKAKEGLKEGVLPDDSLQAQLGTPSVPRGSAAAFDQIQQEAFNYQIQQPENKPVVPNSDPFYIPLDDPNNTLTQPAQNNIEELGQTPEGYYIMGDDIGCWTEDDNMNIIQDPYSDSDIGC